MTLLGFAAVALLVGANAFFVAAEFALVAVDRLQVQQRASEGSRAARLVAAVLERLSYSLSGAQLGITLCSLGLGVLAEPVIGVALEPLFGSVVGDAGALAWSVAAALLLTTVVQMVIGELIPKSIAVARPLSTALALAAPFRVFGLLFGPVIAMCDSIADRIVRAVGVEPAGATSPVHSREELRRLVRSSEEGGTIRHEDAELLDRTFRFAEKHAADSLTPRVSVQWLEATGSVGDLVALSRSTGLSRFPVCGDGLDDVVGMVHVKDVLGIDPRDRLQAPLTSIIRPVVAVPESKDLESLMFELQHENGQFAVVVDEYGGTAGIITLEDLIEEIVGEIDDEHDPAVGLPSVRRWAGAHLVSGLLHPDEVHDACGFSIPRGDYETLAGFVVSQLGRIPVVGDRFSWDGWDVAVQSMDGRRVDTVELVAPSPGPVGIERSDRSGETRSSTSSGETSRGQSPETGRERP